jgi:Domain of unknown function (DUF4440)
MKHPAKATRAVLPSYSFVSFVVMLLLTGCTIGKEPKHPTWKNATGAEQYEQLMWKAIRDKDWKEVEYRLAPTFVGVDPSGKAFDRSGWVERWKASEIKSFSLAEVTVQPAGTDMIVSYLIRLESGPGRPAAVPEVARVVSVWQQVKGGWVLAASTATPVVDH